MGRCHASASQSLEAPGMTGVAHSNARDCPTTATGLLTLPQIGLFHNGLCLASGGLLMLPCVCRLMVELEANRSAGHPLAGSSERRPAEEKHSTLQQTQAGPQAPHTQAQIQVQSLLYVFAPTVLVVPLLPGGTCLLPPHLYQYNSGCLQLHHLCMVQCIGGLQCQCPLPDA